MREESRGYFNYPLKAARGLPVIPAAPVITREALHRAGKTNSIVDYLKSVGTDSSFANRARLAGSYGIQNYTGTAAQNTRLLNAIRSGGNSGNTSTGSSAKRVHLPASASTWRTYPLNVTPVKKNSDWSLTPSAFGGLTYTILAEPYPNVVTIQTGRGRRNIYIGPDTSARRL